jgi:hypothetical protein
MTEHRIALQRLAVAAVLFEARFEKAAVPAIDVLAGVLEALIAGLLSRVSRLRDHGSLAPIEEPSVLDAGVFLGLGEFLEEVAPFIGGDVPALHAYVQRHRAAVHRPQRPNSAPGPSGEAANSERATYQSAACDFFVERGLIPPTLTLSPPGRNLSHEQRPVFIELFPQDATPEDSRASESTSHKPFDVNQNSSAVDPLSPSDDIPTSPSHPKIFRKDHT